MAVVKIIELVGYSTSGWQDAAENALKEAAKTIRNIVGIDVVGSTAKVENNKIASYKTNVKIAFIAERP
ncbi:MAG: dodecin family protein [Candidatus Bathyarchaeota archaeon]|nr:dodecin family protein [Candidatus Bathyarchaeota archaeon]MDH5734364.1 dodecin family protein [Candidatus Bathyarchaeota archaeon]